MDKILPFNLNSSTTSSHKRENVEYVKPGAHRCKITGIFTSEQLDSYTGTPFISFKVLTGDGKEGNCKFWCVKESDAPKTKEWKTKTMKDFLYNAGVKNFSDDSEAMNDAINKYVNVCFISEEYLSKNRDTSEPVIRTAVKYRWSSKEGSKCTYNDNMNKILSEEDKKEFSKLHSEWSSQPSDSQDWVEEGEGSPF